MAITHTKWPAAQVPILNYEKIRARDPVEIERLFHACQAPPVGQGTFFLDLRGPSTSAQTLMNLPAIDKGMMAYFNQSSAVKMADFRPDVERGFKRPDPFEETFEISWDEHKASHPVVPPVLDECAPAISDMSSSCDAITRDVLAALASKLGMEEAMASPQRASDTGLKLCLTDDSVAPGELTANAHTDFGLLTLIFCNAPVMELQDPASPASNTDGWLLIEPVEGCALVHGADALRHASGGVLHSPLHRVVQPENVGPEGTCMTVYYLRPEHGQQKVKV